MDKTSPEQPEGAAQRAQTRRLLEAKIDELPDTFRTVFVLRALEETLRRGVRRRARHPGRRRCARASFARGGLLRERYRRKSTSPTATHSLSPEARCDPHRRGRDGEARRKRNLTLPIGEKP